MTTWSLAEIAELLGSKVLSADNQALGRLTGVLYDSVSREPEWIEIGGGPLGIDQVFAPAHAAAHEDEVLRLSYTASEIEHQPPAHAGVSFDNVSAQRALHAYYGLPFNLNQDLRALRKGDDLPDSVSVSGA